MSEFAEIYDVVIAGGGPAGASAAIHLALGGAQVLLVEQKKFPRAKLCGEFISPECLGHFERLGVAERMSEAGGTELTETVFYSERGSKVSVPSAWLNVERRGALGLSRAEMDARLLERAREAGVHVLEETQASGLTKEKGSVRGVHLKRRDEGVFSVTSLVTIDATGRACTLARRIVDDSENTPAHRSRARKMRAPLVAFKAHLKNTSVHAGHCEIYFYRGGYGGLSSVEDGFSNLCFIARANDVRACGSDPLRVMREIVCSNERARRTLAVASAESGWLSVALEGFGRRAMIPARGLLSIGDAASFIDPFTGSGMLMALESGEIAASAINSHLAGLRRGEGFDALAHEYSALYNTRFGARLRVCSLLRRAAFVPGLAGAAIRIFGTSERLRRRMARATREGMRAEG